MTLLARLHLDTPLIQAPMAGVSTPVMAAEVSNAGALGSIGIGAVDAKHAQVMIAELRERCSQAFNVNVFCHQPAVADATRESRWLQQLRPQFAQFAAQAPSQLNEIYRSFLTDDEMLALLIATPPRVLSFHFGVPDSARMQLLRAANIVLIASVTSLAEGRIAEAAGVDAVVAQGYEAGGHRGVFDPDGRDDRLGTFALTRILVRHLSVPVIAAGGIMDGAGIAAALRLGAVAAQLGTAFIACPESAADGGYRSALSSEAAHHTVMTRVISGRPARCLANRFTAWGENIDESEVPAYPVAYDAGKALNAAARHAGDFGYGAQWAGQGAPLARSIPAAQLVRLLAQEM